MAQLVQAPGVNNLVTIAGFSDILAYNGMVLKIVRTEEWVCEPERDHAGMATGVNHIVIGVRAYVQGAATATNTGGANAAPRAVGDRAGVTMQFLQQILMVDRKQLVYMIGPDVVVLSPQIDPQFLDADTQYCDAKMGPKPLSLRVIEVDGKTALVFFRIETWTGGNKNPPDTNSAVASNRWSVHASVDDDWRTTITTRGRMKVRTDMMFDDFGSPIAMDVFRAAVLPLPIPDGFKRTVPEILIVPDGTEMQWTCVDTQQHLNMGNNGPLRVVGQYSFGADVPLKDAKDVMKGAAGLAGGIAVGAGIGAGIGTAFEPGLGTLIGAVVGGVAGAIPALFQNLVPSVKKNFQFRVYGPVGGGDAFGWGSSGLLGVALDIAVDRFGLAPGQPVKFGAPLNAFGGNAVVLVSLYSTVSIDEPWVELRGEVLGTLANIGAAFNPGAFDKLMNLSSTVATKTSTLDVKPQPNRNPPFGNTSRALYVGRMLMAALKGDFALPTNNAPSAQTAQAGETSSPFA